MVIFYQKSSYGQCTKFKQINHLMFNSNQPNPESSGLRLKVDKPIQNESIPESSGLPFNVNEPNPEDSW